MTDPKSIQDTPVRKRIRRSPDQARQEILNAAAAILVEEGPQAFVIARVAERSGIRHPTILHHFGNVAGLRQALIDHLVGRLINDLTASLSTLQSQQGKLPGYIDDIFAVFDQPVFVKLVSWLAAEGQMSDLSAMNKLIAVLRQTLLDHLRKTGRDQENLPEIVDSVLAHIFVTAVGHGLVSAWPESPFGDSLEKGHVKSLLTGAMFRKTNPGLSDPAS